MVRYAVVRHPAQHSRLKIHALLHGYTWESIDLQHVLLLADIDPRHEATLDSDPDVWLAPSVFTETTLQAHAHLKGKDAHYQALKVIGIQDGHKVSHLAEFAAKRYGQKLALNL